MKKKTVISLVICLILTSCATIVTAFFTKTESTGFVATFYATLKRNGINVYSFVSFALGASDFLFVLITGSETPKSRSVWVAVKLFTATFLYQCASDIFLDSQKEVGTIAIIAMVILFHVYTLIIDCKKIAEQPSGDVAALASGQALTRYAKRKIGKAHQAITSIQIYRVVEVSSNSQVCYNIDYVDCGRRDALNLNAVLNTRLTISKESYDLFQPFLEAYEGYLAAETESAQAPFVKTMEVFSNDNISKLKDDLNSHIATVSDITIEDCCASRLVLTYLSCIARIGKENADDYVGVRCDSLNVCSNCKESDNINKQLFSKFRTGFLGALLLKTRPYVFYYEQGQNDTKANRRYISFVLDHEAAQNSYLVLITVNVPKDAESFHFSLLQAIKSVRRECTNIYERHEVKNREQV